MRCQKFWQSSKRLWPRFSRGSQDNKVPHSCEKASVFKACWRVSLSIFSSVTSFISEIFWKGLWNKCIFVLIALFRVIVVLYMCLKVFHWSHYACTKLSYFICVFWISRFFCIFSIDILNGSILQNGVHFFIKKGQRISDKEVLKKS